MTAIGQFWSTRQHVVPLRVRLRRTDLGLTQKQVVTRLGRIGVQTTNRALSSLEHGGGVDVAKLPELACALDCTVTYLLGLTDDPHKWEPDQWPNGRPSPTPTVRAKSWILGTNVPDRRIDPRAGQVEVVRR